MSDVAIMSESTEHLRSRVSEVENTGRWSPGRKACLLELIRRGALTVAQACERYDLSAEEVGSWARLARAHGRRGLAVLRLQELGR